MMDRFVLDVPVVFCTFNRLECTKKVFEQIKAARPRKLYLVSDGARENVQGEAEKVNSVRKYLIGQVDWECEVCTDFANENMGCGKRISSGISKAFEKEDRLIILEDDCVVEQSFFRYCQELLEFYYDDERVSLISGFRSMAGSEELQNSYLFSAFAEVWGWATWKRVWDKYDYNIPLWERQKMTPYMRKVLNRKSRKAYAQVFENVHSNTLSSWAYPLQYQIFSEQTLAVIPNRSMVCNIGFGEEAAHTKEKPAGVVIDQACEMRFPLRHPDKVIRDKAYDKEFVNAQWPFDPVRAVKILLGMNPDVSIWEKLRKDA